jgi:hypothetical protein
MKGTGQTQTAEPQEPMGAIDGARQAQEFLRTWEAAALLRFDGPQAIKDFFKWADRYDVPRLHRGRSVLWERRVLLDFLQRKAWTRRRLVKSA